MTRESTKEMYSGMPIAFQIIDKIYDNFESRTCINCKWNRDGVCVNDESPLCADFVSDDYGCVLWENNND